MKRLLFLIGFLSLTSFAYSQVQYYRATEYAYRSNSGYGWTDWTDWMKSGILITFDLGSDIIRTSGDSPQAYKVLTTGTQYTDSSGGANVKFYCVDHEGINCYLRLRIETNGNSQIYIEYSDLALVFNVRRIG